MHKKQEEKLLEMRERRKQREEDGDYEHLAELDAEFPKEEEYLEELKQEMQKEKNSNTEVQKRHLG